MNIDDEVGDVLYMVPVAAPKIEKLRSSVVVNECGEVVKLPKAEDKREELEWPLLEEKTGTADKGVDVIGA